MSDVVRTRTGGALTATARPARPSRREPRRRTWPVLLVLAAASAAAVGWYLWLHHWWLNSDGSGYLAIGYSVHRGLGFRLPDGAAVSSTRGPLYPLLLAGAWPWRESLGVSIWMSRLAFVAAPAVAGALVWRTRRSLLAVAAATVVAITHPWTLIAGGSLFVPDGMVAVATLAAVTTATMGRVASRHRAWWYGAGIVASVIAIGTKETGLFALAIVGAVAAVARWRPRRGVQLGLLLLLVVAVVAILVAGAGHLDRSVWSLPSEAADRLAHEAFGESWVWVPALVVAALVVVWAIPRVDDPLVFSGLALCAVGTGLALYAAGRGWGVRNGAPLPFGIALLVGALVAGARHPSTSRSGIARGAPVLAVVLTLALVGFGIAGSRAEAHASRTFVGWNNDAADEGARWLAEHAEGARIACTLLFCSYLWMTDHADLDVHLVPQYAARLGPRRFADLDFTERSGWSGRHDAHVGDTTRPLLLTKSDELFGAIFEQPLLEDLRRSGARYFVVTGNASGNSTFEAGRIIPYLQSNPAFRLVFHTDPARFPQFVAVYEIVRPPVPVPDTPRMAVSGAAYRALTREPDRNRWNVLTLVLYRQMLTQVFAPSPPPSP